MVASDRWPEMAQSWVTDLGDSSAIGNLLVGQLAASIILRWKNKADESPNPELEFAQLYCDNERNAKAAIVATLELVKLVGEGGQLLQCQGGTA